MAFGEPRLSTTLLNLSITMIGIGIALASVGILRWIGIVIAMFGFVSGLLLKSWLQLLLIFKPKGF